MYQRFAFQFHLYLSPLTAYELHHTGFKCELFSYTRPKSACSETLLWYLLEKYALVFIKELSFSNSKIHQTTLINYWKVVVFQSLFPRTHVTS